MSEPLERWDHDAPKPFRAAKAAYGQLGPDAEQLERMLERVEQAASLPAAAARGGVWLGSKFWYWLLPALCALGGVWLWMLEPRPAPASIVPKRDAIGHAAPARPSAPAVPAPQRHETKEGVGHGVPPEPAATTAVGSAPRAKRASDPLAELALLDRARRVIGKDPARALALAEEHARHYRAGQFAEERELLAIEALVRLARRAAAERRARLFRRAHPNSVHAHRLGVILSPAAR